MAYFPQLGNHPALRASAVLALEDEWKQTAAYKWRKNMPKDGPFSGHELSRQRVKQRASVHARNKRNKSAKAKSDGLQLREENAILKAENQDLRKQLAALRSQLQR